MTNEIHDAVRDRYGEVARQSGDAACCAPGCCGSRSADAAAQGMGYDADELARLPAGTNLGLGCGNPIAIAGLRAGETVLDLGSGAGIDCLLAAERVGPAGYVIGVDMTPEMIDRARRNATEAGVAHVEFRLGTIEDLPVDDASVDTILSNCVVNLSPDKRAVYREAFRVLRPGGRLAISDVVATAPIPQSVRSDLALHAACLAGAATVDETEQALRAAGFAEVLVTVNERSRSLVRDWAPGSALETMIASASVEAVRP